MANLIQRPIQRRMQHTYGSHLLLSVSSLLAVLLLALAVIQYRWAGRLAVAEAERTATQLRSAAELFARDFDLRLAQTYVVLQTQAAVPGNDTGHAPALSHTALIQDLYLLIPGKPGTQVLQETGMGTWVALDQANAVSMRILQETALQGETESVGCDSRVLDSSAAVLVPLPSTKSTVVIRTPQSEQLFSVPPEMRGRCLYATLNPRYLQQSLFPDLIRKHFGENAGATYDFQVVSRKQPSHIFFHTATGTTPATAVPSIVQPVFAMRLEDMLHGQIVAKAAQVPGEPGNRVFIHAIQTHSVRNVIRSSSSLAQTGVWQLEIRPKAGPLPGLLKLWRQQNLVLSLAVETLLLASIGFLLISTRRMQRLASQKMQFVAGVSHELRNPLAAIAMLSRNQQDGLVRTPEQVRQYGSLIHEQARRLTEMVEKTLQHAGIQSGHRMRELAEVSVSQVVEEAVASRKLELDQAGFTLEVDVEPDLPPVAGDASSLRQALENLLSNALKYAEDGRWIRVKAWPEDGGKTVSIAVEDRGPGVEPSEARQIFEPFYRGRRAVDAQIPGSGLGLSLVRSTVEAHQGAVVFAKGPEHGASFTIRLPAMPGRP
ncbi:MAG: HAMP domain-containing histidine kinase [Acidobacteriota bacterium]|nr:HAMP domain-containing histidine kinase [Acidobacteriota bacterium]